MTECYSLHLKIKAMRKRLINIAEKHGYKHPLVLSLSRKLDELIVEHMKGELQRLSSVRKARIGCNPENVLLERRGRD